MSESIEVLLVDDDPSIREICSSMLELMGGVKGVSINVTTASDGEEGLTQAISDKKFDLIITDRDMPRFDGIEMAREIKSRLNGETPPIILSSASIRPVPEGIFSGIVSKPYTFDELSAGVRTALSM